MPDHAAPAVHTAPAASGAYTPDNDLHRKLELVRDQVDQLQIQAGERKKPWYRQPSTLMSVVALAVSVTFSTLGVVFRLSDKAAADEGAKVSRIRDNLATLAQIQLEQGEAMTRAGNNPQMLAGLSSAYNVRRQMLIEDTEALIAEPRKTQLTSALLVSFAQQLASDTRVDEAIRYYELGLQAARTDVARANVHRGHAMTRMLPGPHLRLDEARGQWRLALAKLANVGGDYAAFLTADNLRAWSFGERALGNALMADSLLSEARASAQRMVNPYGRAQMLALLDADARSAATAPGVLPPAAGGHPMVGDWELQFGDGRRGRMTITLNTFNQMWAAQISVMSGGRVVETRNAFGPSTDGSALVLTWQGGRAASVPGMMPTPISGSLRLRRTGDRSLSGSDEPLGGTGVSVRADVARQ